MTDQPAEEAHRTGRSVRLDTLVRLRWLAVIGQTTAVLVVYFGLDYELPIWAGVLPLALTPGDPAPDPALDPSIPTPEHVASWARLAR